MNLLNAKFTVSLFLTIITYIFSEFISLKYYFILFFKKIFMLISEISQIYKKKKKQLLHECNSCQS
jgi:hypothetical protein